MSRWATPPLPREHIRRGAPYRGHCSFGVHRSCALEASLTSRTSVREQKAALLSHCPKRLSQRRSLLWMPSSSTRLDARKARLVQIGATRLKGGKLDEAQRFESLVNPGCRVPKAAVALHGIETLVADAPRFAAVADPFEAFLGKSIGIGHAHCDGARFLRAVAARGEAALSIPVGSQMKAPLQTVRRGPTSIAASAAWIDWGSGILASRTQTRNLLRHRATTAVVLGDKIDSAPHPPNSLLPGPTCL